MFAALGALAGQLTAKGKALVNFGKSVLSESDGTGSASRTIGLTVTFGAIGVLIAVVWINHSLPTADQLYGLAALVTAGSGAYLGNKFGRRDNDDDHHDDDGHGVDPPQGS